MSKVMIVDSSPQNTFLISQILEANGYETITAESGLNALVKLEMLDPDLIVLDMELHDMSGFDFCKRVKNNPMTDSIMLLCMTSLETKEVGIRMIGVGADDFMEKTDDSSILLSKVKTLSRAKSLSDQLKKKFAELEEKNALIELQLEMGRRVQRSVIPELNFVFNGVGINSRYMPALAIGGDFFDAISLDQSRVGIVMGDVSGHGISAALLTAMLNMMTKSLVKNYANPDQLLFHLNNDFYKIFENASQEMYACVFYAVINTDEKKIMFSNAGLNLPVLIRGDESEAFDLDATGYPIGLMKDSNYEYREISYLDGDLLFFYTDGLPDIYYKDNPEKFSLDLKTTLIEASSLKDPSEILGMVLDNFYDYSIIDNLKYNADDVSIVLCSMR